MTTENSGNVGAFGVLSTANGRKLGEKEGFGMGKGITSLSTAALALSLAACSGAESEQAAAPAATETTAAAPAAADTAAAPAAAGGAPAVEDTATLDGTKLADFTPDVAHGKVVFLQCQACHALEAGKNKIGPSLAGLVGRTAGTVPGYTYSAANKNSGITWTEEKLFQYLEKPQRIIPGTKMAFAGLSKGQDRADVIAYIKSGGS
jgi:cytochrome c